jgi:histidine triad (HIT) family protein
MRRRPTHQLNASCRFCCIAHKQTESAIVMEDECSMAFLDHRPLFPGHCLLVPRHHYGTLAELPQALLHDFFHNVQLVSSAVEAAMHAEGTFVAINNRVSQSVPHLHVHIVPRRKGDGLKGFFWPRHPYKDLAEVRSVQEAIAAAIRQFRARSSEKVPGSTADSGGAG